MVGNKWIGWFLPLALVFGLTGCNFQQALFSETTPIFIGLKVGQKAPPSVNLVVGRPVLQNGKPEVFQECRPPWRKTTLLPWCQGSTAQTPESASLQRETIAQGLQKHHALFVMFDVPVHETNGSKNFYEALYLQQRFGAKMDFIFVDPWQDADLNASRCIEQWDITTSAHHAYFLVDHHGVIRYAQVGFFSVGGAAIKIRELLARHYAALWRKTSVAARLPWAQQPGNGGAVR